ncbi:MAG: (d)CMP kinase [Phycisphaerales bacterium]|nr:(d)CMP kinase [Phycisphaerales bacterium]
MMTTMHATDLFARTIITIDGPAGTGKSSVGRALASRLGLDFLDTGAMYRAAAVLALENNIPLNDESAIAQLVREADIRFNWHDDPPTLLAGSRALTARLRDQDVSQAVSPVAGLAAVRRELVSRQRRIGEAHPRLVSEGRDQGSVVFPDACVKFYMDASAAVRAQRRADQIGETAPNAVARIEAELIERDRRDANRAVGPLRCPSDAVRIDTDLLDQEGVVERLVEEAMRRVPALRELAHAAASA